MTKQQAIRTVQEYVVAPIAVRGAAPSQDDLDILAAAREFERALSQPNDPVHAAGPIATYYSTPASPVALVSEPATLGISMPDRALSDGDDAGKLAQEHPASTPESAK